LRYENADATLDELAAMHKGAVTKSGINHRLRRLVEIYSSLFI
jgi:DNA-binding transcriptional regulator WhiA